VIYLKNSYEFLHYCSSYDDNEDDDDDDYEDESELYVNSRISYIIDAWAELGYRYFYQLHNPQQALDCYTREKDLSLTDSKSQSCYFNPLLGSYSERMGDVYASKNDIEQALILYKEALDLSMQETFVNNAITAARCMCKIGRYNPKHDPETFYHAFKYLICGYGKPYTQDTIGKCYVYLSRSLQRNERYEEAFKYAKQAISVFLPDPLLLERLIDGCCELLRELHESINKDNAHVLTKEELLKDRISLNDEKIKSMLETTLEELKNELDNK
jgi:tetratricopeptide (TPR) repeat protein